MTFRRGISHCARSCIFFNSNPTITDTALPLKNLTPNEIGHQGFAVVSHIFICGTPYRIDIYGLLNRTSSRIVRVAAANGLAQEFRILLPASQN